MTFVADTSPYPWPWNGELDPEHLALVVTGWDRHWLGAVGPCPEVLSAIELLAAAAGTVISVSHTRAARWPRTAGSPVADLPDLGGTHLVAAGVDAFFASPLDHLLRSAGVDTLLLAGLGLETTVHSTMRTANDTGLECLCVADACAPIDPAVSANAVSMIEMSGGIFGAVGRSAAVVDALRSKDRPDPTPRPPDPTTTETLP